MLETMSLTQVLAVLMGTYFLVVGIGVLISSDVYARIVTEMRDSISIGYIAGVLTYALGAVLVAIHNDWSNGLAMVVSFFAWLTLIKGIILLAFRGPAMSIYGSINFSSSFIRITALLNLVIGALLVYWAYM